MKQAVWPDVEIKISTIIFPKGPKSSRRRSHFFKIALKVIWDLGSLLLKIGNTQTLQNRPTWSHWTQYKLSL